MFGRGRAQFAPDDLGHQAAQPGVGGVGLVAGVPGEGSEVSSAAMSFGFRVVAGLVLAGSLVALAWWRGGGGAAKVPVG
ncbi:hypothetical protein ACFUGD_09915 [Streptomyces sp. NPDC057217]|uniref:hypothetical protein n=1 Tax=Streptomyces sp. NPDC057217 TaxID=3346054 RepID=UPI00363B842F